MQALELSIILPVKDAERELPGILQFMETQTEGLEKEIIVVDMGSSDRTVWEAVQFIKGREIHGCVVQNGPGTVPAALNTGLQKAAGEYVSFIFARRLYRDFIRGYLETARRMEADLIYGSANEAEAKLASRRAINILAPKRLSGPELLKSVVKGEIQMDMSAILFRRSLLLENHISFEITNAVGYSEEFIYRCLLAAKAPAQSPTVMRRYPELEMKRGKTLNYGRDIFQYVDSMRRIETRLKACCPDQKELLDLFTHEKIPSVILYCVDVLLREGESASDIRGYLRQGGYDRLLTVNRHTSGPLYRRVQRWKLAPMLYRPAKEAAD
ncbi:MAG TPA: glycosyltransferase [Candidatus Gallacutalibacter pullicola]|uniref:Glycosyltransferase n=1 Tax=Candidatus Gallacutalibacter pullicola TaxID=2840830 RepID=A0A9D1DPU9_9FIRM|nr:glycosyltransferase [Candidatus Gallacutalibacter pullicola]